MKGDLILVENTSGGFISKAIQFFTGGIAKKNNIPKFTHAMYEIGDVCGVRSVLSAESGGMMTLPLDNFRTNKCKFKVYRIKDMIPSSKLEKILKKSYKQRAGKSYGFLQLLWFVYRWLMERVFNFEVKHQRNPLSKNYICSEDSFELLQNRIAIQKFKVNLKGLYIKIKNWNPNNIHPVDLGVLIKTFPEIFELTEVHGFDELTLEDQQNKKKHGGNVRLNGRYA